MGVVRYLMVLGFCLYVDYGMAGVYRCEKADGRVVFRSSLCLEGEIETDRRLASSLDLAVDGLKRDPTSREMWSDVVGEAMLAPCEHLLPREMELRGVLMRLPERLRAKLHACRMVGKGVTPRDEMASIRQEVQQKIQVRLADMEERRMFLETARRDREGCHKVASPMANSCIREVEDRITTYCARMKGIPGGEADCLQAAQLATLSQNFRF